MDNFSHTFASLAAGEFIQRSLAPEDDPARQGTRRRLLLTAAALAGNFPDLDLLLTPLLPAPLSYLLHHRGHTHTLLYALPQALLVGVLLWLLWPAARRLLRHSASARRGLALALAAGLGLHLGMDYLNSYGLHPFHPFDNGWRYGDLVFILEPFFWVCFGAPLAMMLPRRRWRLPALGLLLLVPAGLSAGGFLAGPALAALVLCALLLAALQQRAGSRGRAGLLLSLLLALGFVALQAAAGRQARQMVRQDALARDGASQLLDIALTPYPSHPLCWNFVSIEIDPAADRYRARRGQLSIAPGWVALPACPPRLTESPPPGVYSDVLNVLDQHQASLEQLRRLRRDNCHFEAWLRFARAPALEDGIAFDLRYTGSARGANFTDLPLAAFPPGQDCPRHVPPWDFPRRDLFGPG